ncbi:hypothetical protein D5S18_23735 [Nocardia panacis]|uniref:Uncharacterized protein n=1 Tax=Nocardia panacis TaxID=2340916 RepID=A0A3A4KE65_9NOCA|nr:hypothetical protein [Nocardia panacis]RJO72181.1 hypothetical protein D5S18_23735 [Nocardia panacis]
MLAPVPPTDSPRSGFVAAAFGPDPGRAATELPEPADALDSWYGAVILGGQGRYAAARALLREIPRRSADPVLGSLAAATEGSLLRQLGWHARAAAHDGRAVALVLPALAPLPPCPVSSPPVPQADSPLLEGPPPSHAAPDARDALCDALTGLAADALGTGRLALAARLLYRTRTAMSADPHRWRAWIRWHWVCAETALVGGHSALEHARAAVALAERAPSTRHLIKSRLLLAAAYAAAGQRDPAAQLAETVAAQCRAHELLALRWAAAMLRAGLTDTETPSPAASVTATENPAEEAAICADLIARRGGRLRPFGAN